MSDTPLDFSAPETPAGAPSAPEAPKAPASRPDNAWPSQEVLERMISRLDPRELAWAYQSGLVIRELVNQRWRSGE